jgi:hypothetical protein
MAQPLPLALQAFSQVTLTEVVWIMLVYAVSMVSWAMLAAAAGTGSAGMGAALWARIAGTAASSSAAARKRAMMTPAVAGVQRRRPQQQQQQQQQQRANEIQGSGTYNAATCYTV